ncbi:MAG: RNA polymerase sigma-70 factor [Bacteroidetes bacterium]|nr:RNA polymerase sigma-70 factor [Bacteroidota bacterium]
MWPSGLYNKGSNKIGIEEFRQIFLDLYPVLCLYALKFVVDIDTSKDIVQDVLTRFWIENEKLLNKNLIKPYLYKAVKNQALNYNKREKRKTGLDELLKPKNSDIQDSDSNDAIEKISFNNLQVDLEIAIDEMPEQRRKIFKMSRMEQMKHKEIAAELNISPKTVETQIYRSLNHLREKLKHYLD